MDLILAAVFLTICLYTLYRYVKTRNVFLSLCSIVCSCAVVALTNPFGA